MRRKLLIMTLILCVLVGVGLTWFIPYYSALYHTPAIRYDNKIYLGSNTGDSTMQYQNGESVLTFSPVDGGTQVTLDFSYYTPQSFLVTERSQTVTVAHTDGAPALSGIWHDGKLIDPQTGQVHAIYDFEILSDAPSASLALWMYEAQKNGIRGKPGAGFAILTCFVASSVGLWRIAVPRNICIPGLITTKQMLAEHPMLRQGAILFFCIVPLAAIPIALYWAVA